MVLNRITSLPDIHVTCPLYHIYNDAFMAALIKPFGMGGSNTSLQPLRACRAAVFSFVIGQSCEPIINIQ